MPSFFFVAGGAALELDDALNGARPWGGGGAGAGTEGPGSGSGGLCSLSLSPLPLARGSCGSGLREGSRGAV